MKFTCLFTVILCVTLGLSGHLPSVYAQESPNSITLDNRSEELATVKLVGPTRQTVEVPQGQSRTVKVTAGRYYLLVRYGNKPGHYTYVKGDTFTVQQTATQYSAINITLHKVIGGNYPAHPTSREEFDKAIPHSTNSEVKKSQTIPATSEAKTAVSLVENKKVEKKNGAKITANKFVITGFLQKKDGTPAVGIRVYVFPYKNQKLSWHLGLVDGVYDVANPSGKTDTKGRFVIEFRASDITEANTQEFAVGLMAREGQMQANPFKEKGTGAMMILDLSATFKTTRELDLNKVIGKIIVE